MLRSAQNCKKFTFFDNLQTITRVENMEARQMTPFFNIIFLLYLFVTFILHLKIVKIQVDVVAPLVHIVL